MILCVCLSELLLELIHTQLVEYSYTVFESIYVAVTIFLCVCVLYMCLYVMTNIIVLCVVYVYNYYVQYLLAREHSRRACLVM